MPAERPPLLQVTQGRALADDFEAKSPQNVRKYVDVEITAAQLLALFATPQPLVPAPGAGKVLIFDGALFFLDWNSVAFNGIAVGEDLAIKYTDAAGLQVASIETTGFLDATADAIRYTPPYAAASLISSITPVANSPLVLHMLTADIATGNSPLKVRTFYYVLPTTFLL